MIQEIYGVRIHGLKAFLAECQQVYKEEVKEQYGYGFDLYKHSDGIWCIYYSKLFPCFDSSDYAYEDRCYRTLIFCQSEQEAFSKLDFIKQNDLHLAYLGAGTDYEELKPYINYNDR